MGSGSFGMICLLRRRGPEVDGNGLVFEVLVILLEVAHVRCLREIRASHESHM